MPTKMTKSEIVKKTTAPKRVRATHAIRVEEVDRKSIAQRAYERFVARGMTHGSDVEDWLAAERELTVA